LRATCEKQQTELARVLSEQIGEANFDLYTAMYLDKTQRVRAIVAGRYNEVIFEDYTPLTLACQLGKLDVVTWLIEKKADINLPAKRKTPLGHAIQGRHTPVVELLLEKGASPLSAFQHNAPALFLAVEAGYTDIVEVIVSFLIRHDAKFDLVVMPTLPKDLKAYSQPVYIFSGDKLFYAASTQKSCMRIQTVQNRVEELKVELNIATLPQEKMKCFPKALTHEDVAYLRGKIDEKVAWINRTYQGRTLLLVAAFHGYEKIVQTLLAAGASPHAKDIIGNTPLHLAAQGGHTGVCRHLSQAMLQPCNQQGATPEQLAAKQGHHNVKDLLSVFSPFSPVEPEVELIQSAASDEKKEDEKTHLQPSFH
jgi:ankyrin repeat protein